jgi:hypothetical protein
MVTVPSQYNQYITAAAAGTGLPIQVVAAQASAESAFNPSAVSSTGAEGFWQFEPSTFNAYAAQAGVPANSEFNVADETQVYIAYMNDLLKGEGGSVFNALEAYNAGPGNIGAGANYATTILQNAGQSTGLNVSNASTTSFNPSSIFGGILSGLGLGNIGLGASTSFKTIGSDFSSGIIGGISSWAAKALGVPSLKDAMQRLGLILLGAILIIVGLVLLTKGPAFQAASEAAKVVKESPVKLCRIVLRLTVTVLTG